MRDRSAWFVKEINDGPGQAADQDDEKTERTDENGSRLGHSAKAMQHDLQDFFPEPNSGETDRQRRDRALYRHDGKEIDQGNGSAQRVSGTEKSGERGKMRDDGCAERDERRTPMPRVQVIGSGDFDQLFATGKFCRQPVE